MTERERGGGIGAVLPIAVAIAIFPVPIIAVVLVLGAPRGVAKALAFVAAWLVGLAAVGAIVLVIADEAQASESGEPATWVNVLLLVLGVVLLALAVKQWRDRPRAGEAAPVPGWMRALDQLTIRKAFVTGFALTAINPKNAMFAAAAAAEIAAVGLSTDQELAVLLIFVVVASCGVLAPLVLTVVLGERSAPVLKGLRTWMTRNTAVIMSVLFVLIGAKLIGDAIAGFAG